MTTLNANFNIPVANTAVWVAVERYLESKRPDRLINDPFAEILVGQEGIQMREALKQKFPEMPDNRMLGLRAKWVEDTIRNAIASGVTQIVNPACGLDTYAWRLNLPSQVTYYELDFPEVIYYKQSKLSNEQVLCNYKAIPVDLREASWTQKLIENGFDKTKKTLWITMGFLYYIPEAGVHTFLDRVNELSCKGSVYTCDIFKRVKSDIWDKVAQHMKENKSPLEFRIDNAPELFVGHGFHEVVKNITFYDYSESLGVKFTENDKSFDSALKDATSLILVRK